MRKFSRPPVRIRAQPPPYEVGGAHGCRGLVGFQDQRPQDSTVAVDPVPARPAEGRPTASATCNALGTIGGMDNHPLIATPQSYPLHAQVVDEDGSTHSHLVVGWTAEGKAVTVPAGRPTVAARVHPGAFAAFLPTAAR